MDSLTNRNKKFLLWISLCAAALGLFSLFVGKYPLTLSALISGDATQWKVFCTLRLSRTVLALLGGFTLGIAGFVFQTVFRNPLASPDMIGVASGASAGAAAGILLFSSGVLVTLFSFAGAILSVLLALAISALDKNRAGATIVLAGIAVHALAQTVLMVLKRTADPANELASIEYWIMGGLSGIPLHKMLPNLILDIMCMAFLLLMHRHTLMLSVEEGEAKTLGVSVTTLRLAVLLVATLSVACIVSLTGLISFVGLMAPHVARLLTRRNDRRTMVLGGILGACFLCGADILARCVTASELPVSIFTSCIGAPFLIWLVVRKKK